MRTMARYVHTPLLARGVRRLALALSTVAAIIVLIVPTFAWASGGAQLWASQFVGPSGGGITHLAVAPDGRRVYVTGVSEGPTGKDFETLAYSAATGIQKWAARYTGPNDFLSDDEPVGIEVSPDGSTVFVAGFSKGDGTGFDWATIAYDARTGAERWVARYNDPANSTDEAYSLGVSPDGRLVFVAGSYRPSPPYQMEGTVIAYNADSGAQVWQMDFPRIATGLAVDPTGGSLYVASYLGTVALEASSGNELWESPVTGELVANPSGSFLFVRGTSEVTTLSSATGAEIWATAVKGIAFSSLAASDDRVFTTGSDSSYGPGIDYVTQALDATTGAKLWTRRIADPALDQFPGALAVSTTGAYLYVTGTRYDPNDPKASCMLTVAYDATTGHQRWTAQFTIGSVRKGYGGAYTLGVSRDGSRVFVGGAAKHEFETLAYTAP